MARSTMNEMLDNPVTCSDAKAQEWPDGLAGLGKREARPAKIPRLLTNPVGLKLRTSRHHTSAANMLGTSLRGPPIMALACDVGFGKSELANAAGDDVVRREGTGIATYPMSPSTHEQRRVVQTAGLLSAACAHARKRVQKPDSQNVIPTEPAYEVRDK